MTIRRPLRVFCNAVAFFAFAATGLRGAEVWVAERVSEIQSVPPCGYPEVSVNDLVFDSQNRPTLIWSLAWSCGGNSSNVWARWRNSQWEIHPVRPVGGDGAARMALRPTDEHPFLMLRGHAGNESLGLFRLDLESDPDGTPGYFAYLGSWFNRCLQSAEVRPQFLAGESVPRWLFYYPNNSQALGCGFSLNGTTMVAGNFGGADYAIGPDGRNHVLFHDDAALVYNSGIVNQRLVLTNNCSPYAQSVSVAVDSSNRIHAVVAGVDGDWSNLHYFTSPDGAGWNAEKIGRIGRVGFGAFIAVDKTGSPAVAWLRSDGICFARRNGGAWNTELIRAGNFAEDIAVRNITLAFDQNNRPMVAFHDVNAHAILAMSPTSAPQPGTDLELTQTIPSSPTAPGALLTHKFTLRNRSSRDASNVIVSIHFSGAGMITGSSIAPTSTTTNSATFSLKEILSYRNATLEVSFTGTRPGALSVLASVAGNEPDVNLSNNSTTNLIEIRPASCFAQVTDAIGRWPGDGGAQDVIGSANGTLQGDVAFAEGIVGQAFSFNGTNAFVQIPNGPNFNPSGSFSIGLWMKQRGGGVLFSKHECGGGYCRGPALYYASLSPTSLAFVVRDSSGNMSSATALHDFTQDRFYHVACVRDLAANELRILVDGNTVTNISLTGGATGPVRDQFASDGDDPFTIGAFADVQRTSAFFKGEIDDVIFYHRAVSPEEALATFATRGSVECVGPMFVTERLPDGALRHSYSNRIVAVFGKAPYVFTVLGNLPPGIGFDGGGTISGVPTVIGQYLFQVTATDAAGLAIRGAFSLRINECEISVHSDVPRELPFAIVDSAYTVSITNEICGLKLVQSLASGALPAGIVLNAAGELIGTPTEVGQFAFAINGQDSLGQPVAVSVRLSVRPRPPKFVQQPASRELDLHSTLWLSAETDLPASFQWYFDGLALPGATKSSLILTDFAVFQAGIYQVSASNVAGETLSEPASVRVRIPAAERNGIVVSPPVVMENRTINILFSTRPGRTYLVQRAVGDALSSGDWETIKRFVAAGVEATYSEDMLAGVSARFVRILEEPPRTPAPFTIEDTSAFIPVDDLGRSYVGATLPTEGSTITAPFEFRAGGNAPAAIGLRIQFPDGGEVVETADGSVIRSQHARFFMAPESPLQFDELVQFESVNAQDIFAAPVAVETLETLLGKPRGSGLKVTIYRHFPLILTRGVFDGNKIKGAQFRRPPDAARPLPLPENSGDYPEFDLELDGHKTLRIPFAGEVALPDNSGAPAVLKIPQARPVILEISADGHVGISGHADLEFAKGPKFDVDFSFSDPEFFLRIAVARLSFPPLLSSADLLPAAGLPPETIEEALWNRFAQRIDWVEGAATDFAVLTVGDTLQASSAPLDLPVGTDARLDMWTRIALANSLGATRAFAVDAASQSARTAVASHDIGETARTLASLLRLQQAIGGDSADITVSVTEAVAAVNRTLQEESCADLSPIAFRDGFSNLLASIAAMQAINHAQADQVRIATENFLRCYAKSYLDKIGVQPGLFSNPTNSLIFKMQRFEAVARLEHLTQLRGYAQALGIPDDLGAPMSEGFGRLALRVWDELLSLMQSALAANDRRTYLYLFPEVVDLQAVIQSGVLPDRPDLRQLPLLSELQEIYSAAFANGPVEVTATDALGDRLEQLRDDLKRFGALLENIPATVTGAPLPVVRNVEQLQQRLEQIAPVIQSRSIFRNQDVFAALEAGLLNEQVRSRFALPGHENWLTQFSSISTELRARLGRDHDWVMAHAAVRTLLAAAAKSGGITRRAYLTEAARLADVVRVSAALLWTTVENRRQADPSLRVVDMLLPGGIEVDRAAGELRYNARSRTLAGAFTGSLRLPNSGLALNIRNASFNSGGSIDLNLTGSFEVPAHGSLVRFEIPNRRPLHLAIDRTRHITMEGGLVARLQNGMEFEAWASASDPIYRFGAAARGIRLDIAKTLTVNIQVPNTAKLAQLPSNLQPLALEYLAAVGRTLEPLRDLGSNTEMRPLAVISAPVIPEYIEAAHESDGDGSAALGKGLQLSKDSPGALNLEDPTQRARAQTEMADQLEREQNRQRANFDRAYAIFTAPAGPAPVPYPNLQERAEALNSAVRILKSQPSSSATTGIPLSNGDNAGTALGTVKQKLPAMAAMVNNIFASGVPELGIKPLSQAGHEFYRESRRITGPNVAQSSSRTKAASLSELTQLAASFASATRTFTMQDIGLNQDGSISEPAPALANKSYVELVEACRELSEQELTLETYNSSDARYIKAAASLYTARRNFIVRKIREILAVPLPDNLNHPAVRNLQLVVYAFPLILETEDFGQRIGAEPVRILNVDGTTNGTTRTVAGDELIQYISTKMGELAAWIPTAMAAGSSANDKKLVTEFVLPELRRWSKNKATGIPAILPPFKRVFDQSRPVPSGVRATLEIVLEQRVADLAKEATAASGSSKRTADILNVYKDSIDVAEWVERTASSSQSKSDALERLRSTVVDKLRAILVTRARAEQSWSAVYVAAARVWNAIEDQAGRDQTLVQNVLSNEFALTRNATVELIGVIRDHVRTKIAPYDLKLSGQVLVREVHGELFFNRETRYISGEFGGRLEFPQLQNSSITLRTLKVDTDGRFSFDADAEFPSPISFPGFENPRFRGTLTAEGQKAIERSFDGTLHLSGSGHIIGGSRTIGATVTYDQIIENNVPRFRFNVSVSGDVNLRLGNDFVLFNAAADAGSGTTSGGTSARVGGKAGLFRKDRTRDLPADDALLRPDLFEVLVEDVDFLLSTNNGVITAQLRGGKLRLPSLFQNLSSDLCPDSNVQSGIEVSVLPTNPITVTFDASATPPVQFSGGIGFHNFGFRLPVPGMEAALCSAELYFASDRLPELRNVAGSLKLPIPNQEAAYLDLEDGTFTLTGIPTGAISLRRDTTIANIGGMKLDILGAANANLSANCGTAFIVSQPNGAPTFTLNGGMRLTMPAEVFTSAAGDSVHAIACGQLRMSFPLSAEPQIELALTGFELCADSLHLGGAGGVVITNTCLRLVNLERLLTPTDTNPFIISVSGGLRLPNGPSFSLEQAQLRFFDTRRLPDFTFTRLAYSADDWKLIDALPVKVTAGSLALKNPLLPFPQRYQSENVQLTISADVSIPPSQNAADVVLGGAVDNLIVEFDANGFPKRPSIDGFELTLAPGKLKIPPIEELGGKLRIGGLQSSELNKIYIIGRLGGNFLTYKLAFQAAFCLDGPIGMCLDVNLGPSGIVIAPTPIQITGVSGGLSFLNSNADPCAFESYFEVNPQTGNKELKSTSRLLPTIRWDDFRVILDRMQQKAAKFPAPSIVPSGLAADSTKKTNTAPAIAADETALECPGDCPPTTVNILCQPHPDRENYPQRIIFKFTAIDEETLNNVLQIRPETFISGSTDIRVAAQAFAQKLTNVANSFLPPIPTNSFTPSLQDAQAQALQLLYATTVQSAEAAFSESNALTLYERIKKFAWDGIPCQDITLAVAGRGSIVGASAIGYVEGRMISSTAGSAGLSGKLHLLGVPVGQAKGFISWTDANGDPNPSLCGEASVSLGPLDLGQLRMNMTCDECVTSMLAIAPTLMRSIDERLLRDLLSRAAPQLTNIAAMNLRQMNSAVAAMPPAQRYIVLVSFLSQLASLPSEVLPNNLADIFKNAVQPFLSELDPKITFCGEVQPRLFGFPLGPGPDIFVGAQLSLHHGYIGAFGFSPGYFIPIFPPGDRATLSWDMPINNPAEALSAALDGRMGSVAAASEFAREQFDYILENTSYAFDYRFHPFGLKVADVGARMIMPDLLNHPAMPGATWRLPEERGLPSRETVLVAAAVSNVLGQAFDWHGATNDFGNIFPAGSTERGVLVEQRLDMRKDYFPHGGLLGGGRLALPLILTENPQNWLNLLNKIQNEPSPLDRLTAAMQLVNDHILAMTTNGTFSFYLPAPNPLAIYNQHPAPRSLSPAEILDSIKSFDPAQQLRIGQIYRADIAFAKGNLDGEFLGIPIANASLSGKLVPEPGSTNLGKITATAPAGSWVAALAGRPIDLTFNIPAPPALSIEQVFASVQTNLLALRNDTNTDAASINSALLLLRSNLNSALPKFSLEYQLGARALGDFALELRNASIFAYSPMFDPATVGESPVALARRNGGLALSTGIRFLGGVINAEQAAFALVPAAATLPRISGVISNISINPPSIFGPLHFNANATGVFDSSQDEFLRATGTITPFSVGSFSVTPVTGPNLAATFAINKIPPPPPGKGAFFDAYLNAGPKDSETWTPRFGLPINPYRMEFSAARIGIPPLGNPALIVHGVGGINSPVIASSNGALDARVSFAMPASSPSLAAAPRDSVDLKIAETTLARISGLPQTPFRASGASLNQVQLSFAFSAADVPQGIFVRPFPLASPAGIPSALLQGFSVASGPSGSMSFRMDTAGSFELLGSLNASISADGFPGLQAGARVTINNNGIFISGSALNDSATVNISILTSGAYSISTDLSLGPWQWLGGLITISAPDGGPLHATSTDFGFKVPGGVKVTFRNLSSQEQSITMNLFTLDANTNFYGQIDNVGSISVADFAIPAGFVTVSGNPFGNVRLNFSSDNMLPAIGTLPIIAQVGNEGIHIERPNFSLPPVILGINFDNVNYSLNAAYGERPHLALSARLPWSFVPEPLRNLSGTINPDGFLDLSASLPDALQQFHLAFENSVARFSNAEGQNGRLYFEGTLSAAAPPAIRGLRAAGFVSSDGSGTLRLETANLPIGFNGLEIRNPAASVAITPDGSSIDVSGQFWVPQHAASALGNAEAHFASDGSFTLAASNFSRVGFASFPFYLSTFQATGNWLNNAIQASVAGNFEFPHFAGNIPLSGTFNPSLSNFSFTSAGAQTLQLGANSFKTTSAIILDQSKLSAAGKFKLGHAASTAVEFAANLQFPKNGDITGTITGGSSDWKYFPGVWAWLDWSGSFSYVNNIFQAKYSGAFYASAPDKPNSPRVAFPGGLKLSTCRQTICGPWYWDLFRREWRQDCVEKDVPCLPATLRTTVTFPVSADGNVTVYPGEIAGMSAFSFHLP